MSNFKPTLTQDEFELLHTILDGTRKPHVKVAREALSHLLMDHSALLDHLDETGEVDEDS